MVGHGGSSAGSYLTDPTPPIPSHCASNVMTSTLNKTRGISDEYWSNHPELHEIPIYYASSLAKKCMSVYQTYINAMNERIRKEINIRNPFVFKHISNLKVCILCYRYTDNSEVLCFVFHLLADRFRKEFLSLIRVNYTEICPHHSCIYAHFIKLVTMLSSVCIDRKERLNACVTVAFHLVS